MTAEATPPFPFVVGCDRSGTTLLRALLDSHAEMAVPSESYFPLTLLRRRAEFETSGAVNAAAVVDFLVTRPRWQKWEIPEDATRARLAEAQPSDMPSLLRELYALYAARAGKPRYGDKTPHFIFAMNTLASTFPEAVFIHIVRDGRDVALSRRDAGWQLRSIEQEALRWEAHVRQGHDDGARLGPARYFEVLYEDLVADTEAVTKQICSFLDLAWDADMLTYYERAPQIVNSAKQPALHANLHRAPTAGLRDWRTQMPQIDIHRFDATAGATLERFGYERDHDRMSPAEWARVQWARARWRVSGRRKLTRFE